MGAFDPIGILGVLAEHGVRHVVIGGIAAAAHGSPQVTQDLDVCYERSPGNLELLAAALRRLNARLRGAPENLPLQIDPRMLRMGDHFTFTTDLGNLDCLGTPSGTGGYDDLAAGAVLTGLDGLTVTIASLDDLIRMKRAAGRPQDRLALEFLSALKDELGR